MRGVAGRAFLAVPILGISALGCSSQSPSIDAATAEVVDAGALDANPACAFEQAPEDANELQASIGRQVVLSDSASTSGFRAGIEGIGQVGESTVVIARNQVFTLGSDFQVESSFTYANSLFEHLAVAAERVATVATPTEGKTAGQNKFCSFVPGTQIDLTSCSPMSVRLGDNGPVWAGTSFIVPSYEEGQVALREYAEDGSLGGSTTLFEVNEDSVLGLEVVGTTPYLYMERFVEEAPCRSVWGAGVNIEEPSALSFENLLPENFYPRSEGFSDIAASGETVAAIAPVECEPPRERPVCVAEDGTQITVLSTHSLSSGSVSHRTLPLPGGHYQLFWDGSMFVAFVVGSKRIQLHFVQETGEFLGSATVLDSDDLGDAFILESAALGVKEPGSYILGYTRELGTRQHILFEVDIALPVGRE